MTRKCVVLATAIIMFMSVGAHAKCTVETDERNEAFAPLSLQNKADLCRWAMSPSAKWRYESLSDGSEATGISDSELEHPEEPDPDAKNLSFAPVSKPLDSKYRVPWLYDIESIRNK